jgi:tetratricopeptide (TPR) repeat protein
MMRLPFDFLRLNATILLFGCFSIAKLMAQNTLDGVKKEVPQEELLRQSAFLDAEKARMLGQTDEAIELYRKFLYKNESADAAWYGLARCYADKKGYGTALETIEKAIQIQPDNQWYYLLKADIFEKNGQHAYAAAVYKELLEEFPKEPAFYEKYAYLLVLAEQPKPALKALDKLEELVGLTEAVATKKHLIWVALGDSKRAAGELQRLVEAYPARLDFRKSLARYFEEIGDSNKATMAWESVLQLNEQDADARLALMEKKDNKQEDSRFLVQLLPLFNDPTVPIDTKIAALTPNLTKLSASSSISFSKAMLDLGASLEKVHKSDPKSWSLSGDIYYLLEKEDLALERYQRCIELRPGVYAVYENALRIIGNQKAYAEQAALAEKAMDLFPNQAAAYFWYGSASNALNRPEEALSTLETALLMAGKNQSLWLDMVDQIALAHLLKKDPDAALQRLELALKKGGEQHAGILEHYGDALAQKGQMEQAIQWWRKAQKIQNSPELDKKLPRI